MAISWSEYISTRGQPFDLNQGGCVINKYPIFLKSLGMNF